MHTYPTCIKHNYATKNNYIHTYNLVIVRGTINIYQPGSLSSLTSKLLQLSTRNVTFKKGLNCDLYMNSLYLLTAVHYFHWCHCYYYPEYGSGDFPYSTDLMDSLVDYESCILTWLHDRKQNAQLACKAVVILQFPVM